MLLSKNLVGGRAYEPPGGWKYSSTGAGAVQSGGTRTDQLKYIAFGASGGATQVT